ncbi:MAG: preprotein translocase subunit SecA [Elusimicrobia bacterium]|nr:preprotein translocase subunit SecA [Candidatus Obscuribacterium magneticum]
MIGTILRFIAGTRNERLLKKLHPTVELIHSLEPQMSALSDEALRNKTAEFRQALKDGKTLADILPEAFAAVREASKRTIGLRHFDVQMVGGIILHQGKIAEMKTGEGKTLVATLAAYLNALEGKGVHIVTVNDYLAKRDREWMGPIYEFLGLTVGFIQHDMPLAFHKEMYAKDITYVTNNEVGFDYLRDNLVRQVDERSLRPFNFAIVDEVDSILIDEARTPLIISGQGDPATQRYYVADKLIPHLQGRFITEKEEIQAKYQGVDLGAGYDYIVDEKNHTAVLTDQGTKKCERLLKIPSLYDDLQGEWVHHITTALKAHNLYKKDVHYVVKEGEVIIVDEFTGRLMPGRRWSDGLHQAVEAKEHMRIAEENQTLATVTFQNFFRTYKKLAGMTGTAMTEANEFWEIYKLDVVGIPTNQPNIRLDHADRIFRSEREKFNAIVQEIDDLWRRGQPVLVGTRSIEKSEVLSAMLRRKGIPHQVLNAKYHEQEAQIIAQAGKKGSVTIATNMAGRGTDILLGGNPQNAEEFDLVKKAGGLHVLGSERHEARRIDNQLRGRCARQGDRGSSRFYLSLEDELMRLFGSERISAIMGKLGMQEGEDIQHPWITKAVESAQKKVEAMNFDIRKQLLDYDNVMNKQREAIYRLRNAILDGQDMSDRVKQMVEESVTEHIEQYAPKGTSVDKWDLPSLVAWLKSSFDIDWNASPEEIRDEENLLDRVKELTTQAYQAREESIGKEKFDDIQRNVLLAIIDGVWVEHLTYLEQLRRGIFLRAYAQTDPLIEFQKEGFRLFESMMNRIMDTSIDYIFRMSMAAMEEAKVQRVVTPMITQKEEFSTDRLVSQREPVGSAAGAAPARALGGGVIPLPTGGNTPRQKPITVEKIGRNDPCPCGSGKKYKKCHGK